MRTNERQTLNRVTRDLLLRAIRTADANGAYAEGRGHHKVVSANREAARFLQSVLDHPEAWQPPLEGL